MILKKPQGASKQKLVKSAQHSGFKWLKPAKKKLTGSDFTSFFLQISVDWRNLRVRSFACFSHNVAYEQTRQFTIFFSKKVSADWHNFRFRSLDVFHINKVSKCCSHQNDCVNFTGFSCPYFRFRSVYVPIHIENLLNCSRHKKNRVHFTNYLF